MSARLPLLGFRCTGCGNCCRDPLLPLTDADLRRITDHTGLMPMEIVKWVSQREIDLPSSDDNFVHLRPGRRVMVLRHYYGRCRFLDARNHCTIYAHRPQGCRIFPFDPSFSKTGKLIRLRLIDATDCPYESDGTNRIPELRRLNQDTERELNEYHERVRSWYHQQLLRKRSGKAVALARDYLGFLGFSVG